MLLLSPQEFRIKVGGLSWCFHRYFLGWPTTVGKKPSYTVFFCFKKSCSNNKWTNLHPNFPQLILEKKPVVPMFFFGNTAIIPKSSGSLGLPLKSAPLITFIAWLHHCDGIFLAETCRKFHLVHVKNIQSTMAILTCIFWRLALLEDQGMLLAWKEFMSKAIRSSYWQCEGDCFAFKGVA